ncbi:MAG: aldehyde dehydrogenase [Bacteroidales bacterium]
MKNIDIPSHLEKMRNFFKSNETKDVHYRIKVLKRLLVSIEKYEVDIIDALAEDLSKSNFESYGTEIAIVVNEIKYQLKHLARWSKPERKGTPIAFFPSKSLILKEPYGIVLVIAPWNYPFQLLINPLVAAVAAGNCVFLKTSPNAPAIAKIMDTIISETFPIEHVSIIHGNREVNQALLTERFDYIFFTGSTFLGKIVMEAAAKYLTPVTLELGGKSPCIIDHDADIKIAARRIVWGKTINCGQTCIAPDYLLVHNQVKEDFIYEMKQAIKEMYGNNTQESPDYSRIISAVAMKRLVNYLKSGTIVLGGKFDMDDNYIEPTVIENIEEDAPILHEEIFGPIFPLIEFGHLDEVIQYVKTREKPLALYYFSKDKVKIKKILHETSSGGSCVNDVLIHIANHKIPFGGVGNSGMGQYHGKYGFDTFTHLKSVVISSFKIDIKIKYPPYERKLEKYRKLF